MSETLLHMEHFTAREQGNGGVGAGPRATTPRSPRFTSPRTGGTLPAHQLPEMGDAQEERRANPEMPGWPGQGHSPPPQGQRPHLINYGVQGKATPACLQALDSLLLQTPSQEGCRWGCGAQTQAGGLGGLAGRPRGRNEAFRVNTLIPGQKGHRTFLHLPRDRR